MDKTIDQETEKSQKYEIRKKQRSDNLELHQSQNRPDDASSRNLDASLKKNTSFIKKLKAISYEQKDALWQEANGLKLDKYIGEVVASLLEAKLSKQADFMTAIEVNVVEIIGFSCLYILMGE
jgi:regulator of nonsense transcripts 2